MSALQQRAGDVMSNPRGKTENHAQRPLFGSGLTRVESMSAHLTRLIFVVVNSHDMERYMNDFDLAPERVEKLRRAQTLARKINLLLDTIMTESGEPYGYAAIRDGAQKAGYYISRTRWSLLKHGRDQVIPEEALRALAVVFDIDPEYLLRDNSKHPKQVEAELALVRRSRRAEVREFAARALADVDPETLRAIAKILDRGPGTNRRSE